jgi:hypothetical protein
MYYNNSAKNNILAQKVALRLPELLDVLNIDLRQDNKKYYGPCPIHSGDNPHALSLYFNEDFFPIWKCYTHHCESSFGKDLLGFIRGVLSKNKYNWSCPQDKKVTMGETIEFVLHFLNEKYDKLKIDFAALEKKKFIRNSRILAHTIRQTTDITRAKARELLIIPADYYLKRDYSPEVLDKYDVGLCQNPSHELYNRVLTPIYDENYKCVLGYSGRSTHKECSSCHYYHSGPCPEEKDQWQYHKWQHSKGLKLESILYNYWHSKTFIKASGRAIIVESPGNIWRLEEAGIHNGVATFGAHLTQMQRAVLDGSGALELILIMDNDEAGQLAAETINDNYSRIYKIRNIIPPQNDLGMMSPEEVRSLI